ncbi:MAG: PIG-L family deacetylase [Phycisphaeraceae bacterium]|nr:PIG-L family deacetylase [Phycisphaeraceae bacterium]
MRRVVERFEAFKFGLMRAVLTLRGRDATLRAAERSAVVIAPHPDDETLGCGAVIMRKVGAGKRVRVVIVTDGRRSHDSKSVTAEELVAMRRREAIEACRVMGVGDDAVVFIGCPDQEVGARREETTRRLRAVIEAEAAAGGAEEVYSPSGIDRNADHRDIAAIVRDLAAAGRFAGDLLEYPVWFWTFRTWMGPGRVGVGSVVRLAWRPLAAMVTLRVRLVSTDGLLDRKRAAIAAHRSQMENLTGEPGWGVLPRAFLRHFFGRWEMFFVVRNGGGA